MAGKRYSAGAIFLQVVPVFANVQRAIEDEAKSIDRALGDQMEKSGEKAGERAGKAASKKMNEELSKGSGEFEREFHRSVDGINKALGGIDVKKLGNGLRRELSEVKKELAGLKDVDLTVDVDRRKADVSLAELQGRVQALRDGVKIVFRTDIDNALKGFAKVRTLRESIEDPIEIEIRTAQAERQMSAFEKSFKKAAKRASEHLSGEMTPEILKVKKQLDDLADLDIGIDISAAKARSELAALQAELRRLGQTSPDIDLKVGSGRAFAELAAFDQALDRIDGRDVTVDINTRSAQANVRALSRSGDDAANSFRSFNVILLAAAGAGPALIPILGAIAGGLLAVGPAAAVAVAGLSAVLVGFSGIGNALTALGAQQDQAAMTAQTSGRAQQSAANGIANAQDALADARRNAARAAEDAAERVADARESAADAIEDAIDRQREAQEAYRDSVQEVKDAEQALREARAAAAGTGADLDRQIQGNSLAQDQALLDEFNTTVTYNATMADGSSTNAEQEQARINMEEAQLRMKELRAEARELAAEKKKWDREGVNGTEEVESAQDNLNDALEAQKDAYEGVREAAQEVDAARRDGAEMVREAIEAQNDTLADNARAIQDAKDALGEARQASVDTAQAINSQQQAVDNAMDALGPAGRKFALFLFGLRDGFRDFRDEIQAAMLPSIQRAIEGFIGSSNAGIAGGALVGLAAGFGAFVEALSVSFQGEAWQGFFQMLATLGPQIQAAYGGAFIAFLEGLASMLTTLAPYALDFAEGFERLMESFASWAGSKAGADGLRDFMGYVEQVAPAVIDFVAVLARALTNVAVALAPYGAVVLGLITSLLDWIAQMNPSTLGPLLGAMLALITSAQIAYAVMNLLLAGTALLTSPVGLLVFTMLAFGAAIYYVYTQNETLGKTLAVVAGALIAAIAAFKIYRVVVALAALAQFGYMTATTGATVSTVGLTAAQRVAFAVGRLFAAGQVLAATVTNALSLAMMRQRLATVALYIALKAYTIGARLAAVGQFLLNAAMLANPFGLIVLAIVALVTAIVILWKENETFRDIVLKVWDQVKESFSDAWDLIKDVIAWIGDAVKWLWTRAIKPALGAIKGAFGSTFRAVKALWVNVLWPVFKAVAKVWWTIWRTAIKVVLVLILALFKAVFWGISKVWKYVLKPVFGWIGDAFGWLKKKSAPILDWLGDRWDEIMRGMKWVWQNVLKPAFDYITDTALPALKGAFRTAVNAIKDIWDGLKKVVGAPIKFVLDTIINKGLIDGFNKVAKWVGMKGFDHIPIPASLQSYATGGVMPGYTPGRDPHKFVSPTGGRLELSGGEAVMRPEFTAAVGPDWVNQVNAAAMGGGINGVKRALGYATGGIVQKFAKGGIVFPVRGGYVRRSAYNLGHDGMDINHPDDASGRIPFVSATSGRVTTTGYSRGYGNAVFVKSPFGELVYGHSLDGSIGVSPGQSVSPGQYLARIGNTGNSEGAHLHFGFPGGTFYAAESLLSGSAQPGKIDGGGFNLPSIPGWIKDIIKNPIGYVKGLVTDTWSKASDFVSESPVFNYVKNVPMQAVGAVKDKVMDIIPGWAKSAAGALADGAGAVKDGLGNLGGGIKDGVGAGLDMIGLAKGGILPYNGTMKYDAGGYLPPGLTSVVNLTGKPEPVFTNDQWSNMETGGQGGTIHYEPHFEGSDLTAADVAGDLNFTFRRIKRGGKYAGVGS